MERYDLAEYYYKEKFQGDRLIRQTYKGYSWNIIHATHISHCIAKAEQLTECNRKDIRIGFSSYSVGSMESGKGVHLLHQREVDPAMSDLKLDWYGWYPYKHDIEGEFKDHNPVEFRECVEVFHNWRYNPELHVYGTLDQYFMNNNYFFIRDIKSTRGYKYVNGARLNHKIQVHVYIIQSEMDDIVSNLVNPFQKHNHFFGNMANRKIRHADVKYVNMFDPMDIKLCNVTYRKKYVDFIHEQLEKYLVYIRTGEITEPNYDYLAEWECNPKYCPFAEKSPLGEDCKFCQWDVKVEEEKK